MALPDTRKTAHATFSTTFGKKWCGDATTQSIQNITIMAIAALPYAMNGATIALFWSHPVCDAIDQLVKIEVF
jgi:hypothetical protein